MRCKKLPQSLIEAKGFTVNEPKMMINCKTP